MWLYLITLNIGEKWKLLYHDDQMNWPKIVFVKSLWQVQDKIYSELKFHLIVIENLWKMAVLISKIICLIAIKLSLLFGWW